MTSYVEGLKVFELETWMIPCLIIHCGRHDSEVAFKLLQSESERDKEWSYSTISLYLLCSEFNKNHIYLKTKTKTKNRYL